MIRLADLTVSIIQSFGGTGYKDGITQTIRLTLSIFYNFPDGLMRLNPTNHVSFVHKYDDIYPQNYHSALIMSPYWLNYGKSDRLFEHFD